MGMVKIEIVGAWLRLRWTHQRKRHYLGLKVPNTKAGMSVATKKAALIEGDLITGNFDPSLNKYKPQSESIEEIKGTPVIELFEQFSAYRSKGITSGRTGKYKSVAKRVRGFFEGTVANAVDEPMADRFREAMGDLSPDTRKSYLGLVSGCWVWGIKQGLVKENPWGEVTRRVKVPPKQKDAPFSKDEVAKILNGFENDRNYSHYTDFVRFLFSTGCRPGEAAGLRWQHLGADCGKVWIGESLSRGVRKPTKTNRAREFRPTSDLQKMLITRRPVDSAPDDLVFPSPKGGAIDDHNFRNRAWVTVLQASDVTYRVPYNTRHTFISHALKKGVAPMTIAKMTGHDPEVLFKHYASDIGEQDLPELF